MGTRQQVPPAVELQERHLRNSTILPNRYFILSRLQPFGRVAEVGVAFGDFSASILKVMKPIEFVAIDLFNLHEIEVIFGMRSADKFAGRTHEEFYRKRFENEMASGQVSLRKGFSTDVLNSFPEAYFDMIYIDAAHDYANVKKDLQATKRVIRDDGIIIMNDYIMANPFDGQLFGVVQATHEFCLAENWEFLYLTLHPFMYCDVALRKIQ